MELQYKLEQREIEESLLCLNWRKEGWKKYLNAGILSILAAGCLIGYVMDTRRFFLMAFGAGTTVLLFILLYIPQMRRRSKARAIIRTGGDYRVALNREKYKHGFESEWVFTLQKGKEVYCIPKRILNGEQQNYMRQYLKEHAEKVYEVITGRERENG